MTRVLSELLGAREPMFRLGLHQLEQASGMPSDDIRLTGEIMQQLRTCLHALDLDPQDTTGQELYAALQERVKLDEAAIRKLLVIDENDENVMLHVKRLLYKLDVPKDTFALRPSAAKRIIKKMPPKKAMKALGYRSVDSMLKHEPIAQLLAAAAIVEAPQWHKSLLCQYKQLLPTDFEVCKVQVLAPNSAKWAKLSGPYVAQSKHNILSFKEVGAVIMLPLPVNVVSGAVLMTTLIVLHAINDIRATSTYLKLHQVRPDFGAIVARVARSEPYTQADLIGERLPWKLVQRYFSRNPEMYSAELFDPHVQLEDLKWQTPEHTLAKLLQRFEFWKPSAHVGMLEGGSPVSLNLTDAALNFCNRLPYEQRVVQYLRDHLWHELMLRYMHQQNLEQVMQDQLGQELVDEKTLA